MSSWLSPDVNNNIYCKNTVTVGIARTGPNRASPVNIVGAGGREVYINGVEVNADPETGAVWKNLGVATPGFDGLNILENTFPGQPDLTAPTTKPGFQVPQIILIPRSATQAQVFTRGTMTVVAPGLYANGTMASLPAEYQPPGDGKLEFINSGDAGNVNLGMFVTGAAAAARAGEVQNALGGSDFGWDGISWWVNYTE
jgi:hypothetical protein